MLTRSFPLLGDLYLIYGGEVSASMPKSILKPSNHENEKWNDESDDLIFSESANLTTVYTEPAVGDVVVERETSMNPHNPKGTDTPKKQSLFKQNRARK
jgi:hypothetical protein